MAVKFPLVFTAQNHVYDGSAFNASTSLRLMYAAWIRPEISTAYERIIHFHCTTNGLSNSHQLIRNSSGQFVIGRGSSNTSSLSRRTGATTAGEWVHLIAWGEDGEIPSLWLNGVNQTSSSATALGTGANNADLHLGDRSDTSSRFRGDLAEVCAWLTTDDTKLARPSDADAMRIYRDSSNPWVYSPNEVQLYNPYQSYRQPALHLGSLGAGVFTGSDKDAEHAPVTSDNFSFVSIVGGGGADITATGTLAFGSSAGLNATGKLSGISNIAFGGSSSLNAVGTLQAAGSISFSPLAELKAIGSLTSTSPISFTTGATLSQAGNYELTSMAALSFGSVAGLSATGKLEASTGLSFTGAATANAIGSLSAISGMAFGGAAELTQASLDALIATAGMAFGSSATINATGKLEAATSVTLSAGAILTIPGVAPSVPGLEYTIGGSQIHFTMGGDPLHYTIN